MLFGACRCGRELPPALRCTLQEQLELGLAHRRRCREVQQLLPSVLSPGRNNRTPTAILERRGSFISHKNRKDARAREPVVTKRLGSPPKTFTDEQKQTWREFAKMVPADVATYADRWA